MTETTIKPDIESESYDELLEEARRQLGDVSADEAILIALRELVADRRARRGRALERLQQMADEGRFDYSALDEADK